MAGLSRSLLACLHTGQLALLAILVSGGITLQILACALYNNWWPMLTVIIYVILPMPLLFFAGSNSTSLMSSDRDGWVNFTKFLTGASVVGSIAIPSILKHAGVIGWGALLMELSSFLIFGVAILWFLQMNNEDAYSGLIRSLLPWYGCPSLTLLPASFMPTTSNHIAPTELDSTRSLKRLTADFILSANDGTSMANSA